MQSSRKTTALPLVNFELHEDTVGGRGRGLKELEKSQKKQIKRNFKCH